MMSKVKLFSLLLVVLFLLGLSACGDASQNNSADEPSPADVSDITLEPTAQSNAGIPEYLDKLTDADNALNCTGAIKRTDVGVEKRIAPYEVHNYAEALVNMRLRPRQEGDGKLDLKKPFSLTLTYGGSADTFAFATTGIAINEIEYYPSNPSHLQYIYESDEYSRFLTADLFYMEELMDFSADQVASVLLQLEENYSDGVTRLTLTGQEDIAAIIKALQTTPMRRFESDEDAGMHMRVGGGAHTCTFTMRDGTTWSFLHGGLDAVKTPAGEEQFLVYEIDYDNTFGRLGRAEGIPVMKAQMDSLTPTVYGKAYAFAGREKTMTHNIPVDMFYHAEAVLSPGTSAQAALAFTDAAGAALTPQNITATLYRQDGGFQETGAGTPVTVSGTSLTLPATEGKYFVDVQATFPDGSAQYMFSYRISQFPWYFNDISFGNGEGNVVLVRDDVGVQITGGQNRQYVDFILGLELAPDAGRKQDLPVKQPFTIVFAYEGETATFSFNNQSVTYQGEEYFVGNPDKIAALYNPLNEETAMNDDRVDHKLRGFLSKKDVAYFNVEYQFDVSNIKKLEITREQPEEYTVYDVTAAIREQDYDILDHIVIGENQKEDDYFLPRRFYYSFRITMSNGTVYEVGETLKIDGKESGWYTIQSDSPKLEGIMEGLTGETIKRDQRIAGGISIEDGKVSFF